MELSVEIPNLAQIKQVFDRAPGKMTQNISTAIQKAIFKIEANVKREAPVNKNSGGGSLRQSVRSAMVGIASGMVEVGVPYALFVEMGTRPHVIEARNAKVLASRSSGGVTYFGKRVNHPGTKANPFFQRGIEKSQGDISQYFEDAVTNSLS